MTADIFIVGCGGFGREVFQVITSMQQDGQDVAVAGFIDDAPSSENLRLVDALGCSYVGTVSDLAIRAAPFDAVLAIGSPQGKRAVAGRLVNSPVHYPVLVHPSSWIGTDVTLEAGVVITAGARLTTNIYVGAHVHINLNATVGHDTTIGDFSVLNPLACVSGSVTMGEGVNVGAAAVVLPGIDVGADAVIGAASCVVRAVLAGATVKGVPAR